MNAGIYRSDEWNLWGEINTEGLKFVICVGCFCAKFGIKGFLLSRSHQKWRLKLAWLLAGQVCVVYASGSFV